MAKHWKLVLHWLSALVVMVFVLGFSHKSFKELSCNRIEIRFLNKADGESFLIKEEVVDGLYEAEFKLVGQKLFDLDQESLEQFLEKEVHVADVEVFTNLFGIASIEITEKNALIRLLGANKSYYFDEQGSVLPLSPHFFPRVPVVTGNVEGFERGQLSTEVEQNKQSIMAMAQYLQKDAFWMAQIQQLHVDENFEVLLIPRLGNHIIELGKLHGFEEKLRKLKIFYTEGLKYTGWEEYSVINLRFKNQVVCTKK